MIKHIKYKIIFKDEILFYLIHNTEKELWWITVNLDSTNNKEISSIGATQILTRLAWLKIKEPKK